MIIEETPGISIQDLIVIGVFKNITDNLSYKFNFVVGDEILKKVRYTPVEISNRLFLYFESNHFDQKIEIIKQSVHFGGYRYFYKCTCNKKVKEIFWNGNIFKCRYCFHLRYTSSTFHNCRYEYHELSNSLRIRSKRYRKNKHPRKAYRQLMRSLACEQIHEEILYKELKYITKM